MLLQQARRNNNSYKWGQRLRLRLTLTWETIFNSCMALAAQYLISCPVSAAVLVSLASDSDEGRCHWPTGFEEQNHLDSG